MYNDRNVYNEREKKMTAWIIKYNCGCGDVYDVVHGTREEAQEYAYESWREAAESQADYGIECEWTEEAAMEYGL